MVQQCKQHVFSPHLNGSSNRQQTASAQEQDQAALASCSHVDIDHANSNHAAIASDPSSHDVDAAAGNSASHDVVVVCRRGNDSQHTVQSLRECGIKSAFDLIGGLSAWSQHADPSFPDY